MWTGEKTRRVSGVAETEGAKKSSGRQGAEAARGAMVPAEIVRTLPGISTRLVSMMDPQQEQCIPAPRGRGPRVLQEDPKNTQRRQQQRRWLLRKREGERGGTPLTSLPAPSARDPRLGLGGGRSPESHAPAPLEDPMGRWRTGTLGKLSQ